VRPPRAVGRPPGARLDEAQVTPKAQLGGAIGQALDAVRLRLAAQADAALGLAHRLAP